MSPCSPADGFRSAIDSAYSMDAAGHIHKPFQPEELLDLIRHRI